MIKINLPTSEEEIRQLKLGDEVSISGIMVTGRDAAHKYLMETEGEEVRQLLKNNFIYHCGPVIKKEGDEYKFVAAGPTTSIREEPYQGPVFEKYQVRAAIGKGGMGPKTLAACQAVGAVYLHAIGGLGSKLAVCVKKVHDVHKLEEFGSPEAFWVIEVEDFPAVVTMDSHGGSLHAEIKKSSSAVLERLLGK